MHNTRCQRWLRLPLLLLALLLTTSLAAGDAPPTGETTKLAEAKESEEPKTEAGKLLAEGWAKVRLAHWEGAIEAFRKVADASGATDDDQAAALYGQGHCWQYARDNDVALAKKLYAEVVERFSGTRAVPYVLMEQARLADMPLSESDRRPEEAAELYRKIIADHPDHVMADEATLWLAVQLMGQEDQAEKDKGLKLLTDRLTARPDNNLAAAMNKFLANNFVNLGVETDDAQAKRDHFRTAITYFQKCRDIGMPTARMQTQVLIHGARILERELQDYDRAIGWYREVAENYKNDAWNPVAKMAIERCEQLKAKAGGTGADAAAPKGSDDE